MNVIRPTSLNEFVGQQNARRVLSVLIGAAKKRNEPVPHLLMSGPSGLGKTTLARIVAHEMGGRLIEMVGSSLKNAHDVTNHLLHLATHDVLFIDEIHAVPRKLEEILYPAMEDNVVSVEQRGFNDLMKHIGIHGGEKSVVTHRLPPFTLIGATTLLGLCSAPLRSRFRQTLDLQPYTEDELQMIVRGAGTRLGFELSEELACGIAHRSRGTARIAINQMLWFRDVVMGDGGMATMELLEQSFALKGIDENGFISADREYLRAVIESEDPLGIDTLATVLGESTETLTDSIEPHLLRQGLIRRTPRGRVATDKARQLFQEVAK